jgi:hypothetical protein
LLDLVGDDGVEDHAPTIGQGEARVFGLFRRVAYSFALATAVSALAVSTSTTPRSAPLRRRRTARSFDR